MNRASIMASISARRIIQRSSSSLKSILSSNQPTAKSIAGNAAAPCLSRRSSAFIRRLPVELGCVDSLMPFHSATASSLLRSKLSSEVGIWGFLSEGFATTL